MTIEKQKLNYLYCLAMMMLSFSSFANVSYVSVGATNAEIDVDSESFDLSAFNFGYTNVTDKYIFSAGIQRGEIEVYGYDLDYVTNGISFGYGFSDISQGSFVLGLEHASIEIQDPGSSNLKDSSTDPFIGYYKISGEDLDYSISISDSVLSGNVSFPLGEGQWRGALGFSNSSDASGVSFGVRVLL